jgi:hypothetical protein
MTAFEIRGECAVADFIRDLLSENGVSHEALELYKLLNEDKILYINNIFLLKTEEDVRQCAVLLRLLCPEYADDVVGYFLNGNLPETLRGLTDVDRYKLKLLAGLEYNYRFFSLSWNWWTSLREKVMRNQIQPEGQGGMNPPAAATGRRSPAGKRLRPSGINLGKLNMMNTASKKGIHIIGRYEVDRDDIHGELFVIDREKGELEFIFRFIEYQEDVPDLIIKILGKDIPLKPFLSMDKKVVSSGIIPMIDPEAEIIIEILQEEKDG